MSIYNESITVTYAEIARWLQEAEHAVLLQLAHEQSIVPAVFSDIFNILNSRFLQTMIEERDKSSRQRPVIASSEKNKKRVDRCDHTNYASPGCRIKGAKTSEN